MFLSHLTYRYVSAPEAFWRLSEYNMHEQSHTVIRLPVHLLDQQPVYFQEGYQQEALERSAHGDTQLTGWFRLNQEDENAHQYLYTEIPTYYLFNKTNKKWVQRKRNGDKIISRMYSVSPKEHERFYLRILLLHVPGATSYEDLKTMNGYTATTFHEACKLMHLLDDDAEWDNALSEASTFQMPRELRDLYATICSHCEPDNPLQLWTNYKGGMVEDYVKTTSIDEAERKALLDIQSILCQSGISIFITIIYCTHMHS